MNGAIPPLPQYAFMRGTRLKNRDNFTFILPYNTFFFAIAINNCLGILFVIFVV